MGAKSPRAAPAKFSLMAFVVGEPDQLKALAHIKAAISARSKQKALKYSASLPSCSVLIGPFDTLEEAKQYGRVASFTEQVDNLCAAIAAMDAHDPQTTHLLATINALFDERLATPVTVDNIGEGQMQHALAMAIGQQYRKAPGELDAFLDRLKRRMGDSYPSDLDNSCVGGLAWKLFDFEVDMQKRLSIYPISVPGDGTAFICVQLQDKPRWNQGLFSSLVPKWSDSGTIQTEQRLRADMQKILKTLKLPYLEESLIFVGSRDRQHDGFQRR